MTSFSPFLFKSNTMQPCLSNYTIPRVVQLETIVLYCRRNSRFPVHTSPPRKFSECAARFLIRPGLKCLTETKIQILCDHVDHTRFHIVEMGCQMVQLLSAHIVRPTKFVNLTPALLTDCVINAEKIFGL